MRKLGKRRLTLTLQEPLPALPDRARRLAARTRGRGPAPRLSLRRVGRGHRRPDAACAGSASSASISRTSRRPRARSRTFSSIWWDARRENSGLGQSRAASGRSTAPRCRARVRTIWQSVATPVITTALYFVVFGARSARACARSSGVSYGAFIVPGLIMLSLLTQSISNASIGIYFPKFTGTIFETPVRAVVLDRGGVGLCRRGRDQVDRDRPHHSR